MRRLRVIVLAAAVGAAVVGPPAWAHEGEDLPAKTLIEQAIAILRGQPEQREAIEDKIHDALEAKNTKGVDLELVREAEETFEAGEIHETWDLLEEAIGAAPHRPVTSPNPGPGLPAPPPTDDPALVLHERSAEGGLGAPVSAGGWILLGIAAALAVTGIVIVRRVR